MTFKSKIAFVACIALAACMVIYVVNYTTLLHLFGGSKMSQANPVITLENFDDAWGLGYPAAVEKKLRELLPQAEALQDKSVYLQILSQIALAQAVQKKFDEAHKTLDEAQALLTPEYDLAKARILLERGRVFQQAGDLVKARDYFEQSYALSTKNKFDFHAINVAHMIAIAAEKTEDKIKWNQLAIDMTISTQDAKAHAWLGSLYNNLGQNYLSEGQFEKALTAFQKALEYRIEEGYAPNIRVAKWAIARALRSLDRLDEALKIQQELLKEYDAIAQSGSYDVPVEMFMLVRGLVHEELAELHQAKSKMFAALAYDDLSNDAMFREMEAKRVERLKRIKEVV